jgi:group I intron endonuclease
MRTVHRPSGIYRLTNKCNGKVYVGRSVDILLRWAGHKAAARRGSAWPIHAAIRKYGAEQFLWEVLLECPEDEQEAKEWDFIEANRSWAGEHGYNVGGTRGGFPSKSALARMPDELRDKWAARYKANGLAGNKALTAMRADKDFDDAYRKRMSAGGVAREASIKTRRTGDPEYDVWIAGKRSAATKHRVEGYQRAAGEAVKQRFVSDAAYASAISEKRKHAQHAGYAAKCDAMAETVRLIRELRRAGRTLLEISKATGVAVSGVSKIARGLSYAQVP